MIKKCSSEFRYTFLGFNSDENALPKCFHYVEMSSAAMIFLCKLVERSYILFKFHGSVNLKCTSRKYRETKYCRFNSFLVVKWW